ncbi:hypothetical protein EASAB2608_06648 [Streptomyces sp. EAS-AB2608]|nr:hypothetical protein EASAB2608_06648 [Streptomyces sp. EAS-AB2608]
MSGKRAEAGGGGGVTGSGASGTAEGRGRWARAAGTACGRGPRGVKTDGSSSGSSSGDGGTEGIGGRPAGVPVRSASAPRAGPAPPPVPAVAPAASAGLAGGVEGRGGIGACRASVLMHPPFPRARAASSYAGRPAARPRPVRRTLYARSFRARIPVRPDPHPGSHGRPGAFRRTCASLYGLSGTGTEPVHGAGASARNVPYPAVILSGRLPA